LYCYTWYRARLWQRLPSRLPHRPEAYFSLPPLSFCLSLSLSLSLVHRQRSPEAPQTAPPRQTRSKTGMISSGAFTSLVTPPVTMSVSSKRFFQDAPLGKTTVREVAFWVVTGATRYLLAQCACQSVCKSVWVYYAFRDICSKYLPKSGAI
jgi:hypothetical protein